MRPSKHPFRPGRALGTVLLVAVALVGGCVAGCGGSPARRVEAPAELQSFGEAEALNLVRGVLAEVGVPAQRNWPVYVGGGDIAVDLRLDASDYGIEWVTDQDRDAHGEAIPEPDPDGQLRILPGSREDVRAQILVLDHRTYRYDPDRERVQLGAPGPSEAEGRLRRDVQDFLEYVRGQGGL